MLDRAITIARADPRRRQAVAENNPKAEDERGRKAGHRAADGLAVDVANAPDPQLCLPNSEPPISERRVGHDVRAPDEREDDGELLRTEDGASCAPSGTITNLNTVQSVVISRQFARASTPSITRDCGP